MQLMFYCLLSVAAGFPHCKRCLCTKLRWISLIATVNDNISVKARGKIQVYEHYYKLFQISILFLSCETQYDAIEIFSGMA